MTGPNQDRPARSDSELAAPARHRVRLGPRSILGRKLVRDIARRRWQFLAVGVTIVLGVMLYAASYDAFLNLTASYQRTYDDLEFADLTISGGNGTRIAASAADRDSVAAVVRRTQADIPFQVDDDHRLLGRVVGMPSRSQPDINRVDVLDGSYLDPNRPGGVLVERHMADHFELQPGDTLTVLLEDGPRKVDVLGVVASAEYIFPAKSRQELFSLPDDFGVLFVPEALAAAAPSAAQVPQTLVRYEDRADAATVDDALTEMAVDDGADDVTNQEEQPSNAALAEDLQGFSELAFMFPALFLTGAGLATFVMLNRIVHAQRAQIGTLMANGLSRRQVLRHYRSYGLVIGMFGSVIGLLIGVPLGAWMTRAYTSALSIPDTVTELSPVTPVVGLVFGLVMGVLSAIAPARAAVKVDPAGAMRGAAPVTAARSSPFERLLPPVRRLPVRVRMSLRGLGRSRRRSAATVLGVVLAIVLVLASWGMIDTVQILLARQFDDVQHQDAQAFLTVPVDGRALAQVGDVDGVADTERLVILETSVRANGEQYATELQGFEQDTAMHSFLTSGDHTRSLPDSGVLVGEALRGILEVEPGDRLSLSFPALGTDIAVDLAGFVDEPLGTYVYMDRDALEDALADAKVPVTAVQLESPTLSSALVIYEPGADGDAVDQALTEQSAVFTVVGTDAFQDLVDSFLALFYAFVGIMLLFGGIMAFALIFNTISVNISERSTELATMRANGVSSRQVNQLMTIENVILTVIGIPIGLVVGYWVAAAFMAGFSSDLFQFDLQVRTSTYLFIALAVLVVTLVSQWPGLRAVRRIDIAGVVRERAQ